MYISTNLKQKNSICEIIKKNIHIFDSFTNVYLFGSILDNDNNVGDIDILLIYTEYTGQVLKDICCIRMILEDLTGLFIDLTVLSVEEENETRFKDKLNSKLLKLK